MRHDRLGGGTGPALRIELLYFGGCPSHDALLPRVRGMLDGAEIGDKVELRRVESVEEAERERFLGSPTLRVDGHDIEPGADQRTDFGLKCRLYRTAAGTAGLPPDGMVLKALGVGMPEMPLSRPWAVQRVAGLSAAERGLHRRILRGFAAGPAPTSERVAEWADAEGVDPVDAMAALAAHDLVHRDAKTAAIAVAYPFSGRPTPHHVHLARGSTSSRCARSTRWASRSCSTPRPR